MRSCRWMLAAILPIGIAGFALVSLASGEGLFAPIGNPLALQKADDPVRNGFHIIEAHQMASPRVERTWDEDSTVILLDSWIFTEKGKPSPFN